MKRIISISLTIFALLFSAQKQWAAPDTKGGQSSNHSYKGTNLEPIKRHPSNSHYFLFRGNPVTLMTIGEHYGALVRTEFDYEKYFSILETKGLNQTRVFSGTVYVGKNNCVTPWAVSKEKGENFEYKFDLDKWNPEYFKRLKDVLTSAGKHGVVVEFVLFCAIYEKDTWKSSPLNAVNNIQGVGDLTHEHRFMTLGNKKLVEYQKKFVHKIVEECRDFDNVYFEIANEPYWSHRDGVTPEERGAWHNEMISEIVKTEKRLPESFRHMIAVNDAHKSIDMKDVSIMNFHYVSSHDFYGGIKGLQTFYYNGKGLIIDETEFLGTNRVGRYNANDARVEAWEFMIGGGSGYSNLAPSSYRGIDKNWNTAHSDSLRNESGNLKRFVESLDLIKMRRDSTILLEGIDKKVHFSSLSNKSDKYVLYFHNGELKKETAYTTTAGKYRIDPVLNLPAGKYTAEWINPYDLKVLDESEVDSDKNPLSIQSPEYSIDIALVITRKL